MHTHAQESAGRKVDDLESLDIKATGAELRAALEAPREPRPGKRRTEADGWFDRPFIEDIRRTRSSLDPA